MGIVLRFPVRRRHARASSTAVGNRKASIGTSPREKSLRRLARPSDASFLPAKIFRMCESEHPPAAARSATVLEFSSAQRSIGCESVMDGIISTRNDLGQREIFLLEMHRKNRGLLQWPMGKTSKTKASKIHLGGWLDLFSLSQTEAADIAGCKQPYIANISRGRNLDVNVQYLFKLSQHLGLTINDFFVPAPTEDNASSMMDLSAGARESVVKRWKELRELRAQKSAKKRTSDNR